MLASLTDIEKAPMAGEEGVEAALSGETGKMIAFRRESGNSYHLSCTAEDVNKICNQEKKFPKEWITGNGCDISEEFLTYVLPLIQGEPSRVMEQGLPKYLYRRP